jgi:hypothetical protein
MLLVSGSGGSIVVINQIPRVRCKTWKSTLF